MNIDQTILMNLKKLGFVRRGAGIVVTKIPVAHAVFGAGLLCNLKVYRKLFDNRFCYLIN